MHHDARLLSIKDSSAVGDEQLEIRFRPESVDAVL
jgi:hypothetical protein